MDPVIHLLQMNILKRSPHHMASNSASLYLLNEHFGVFVYASFYFIDNVGMKYLPQPYNINKS